MQFSIDLSGDDAEAKAEAMTVFFKQAQQEQIPTMEEKRTGGTTQTTCVPSSARTCLPLAGHMRPATGLFMKQGVQAVCCAFHARAEAQPKRTEEFARWTLTNVTPLSRHSAVFRLTSTDGTRGTPYTRGRGRTIWHKTWHTTLRTTDGLEHDLTPTSTWEQWDAGECDLLVRPSEVGGFSLHNQPLGSEVWLSKPKTTLSVPSLVHPNQLKAKPEALAYSGLLLVLGGAAGFPTAAQILQHAHASTCFGSGAERVPPVQSPVHLVFACERDDVLMTSELRRWCAAEDGARLKRLVLAISEPRDAPEEDPPPPFVPKEAEDSAGLRPAGLEPLAALDQVSLVQGDVQGELPLSGELLQAELAPLLALGRCRVVVSGPVSFNMAVAEMLEAQCGVGPDAITIVHAGHNARAHSNNE